MILNEDYFKDLEIEDEDIIDDDTLDVEEPDHELTLDEFHKLPEQYNHNISFRIENKRGDSDTTFIQTSLLPRLFKKLDTIFELYGIEHSLYILTEYPNVNLCDTVVKFGKYQLFCNKTEEDAYINNRYILFHIQVYVNYPEFTYKRAFRFIYTILNIFRLDKLITLMNFKPIATNDYVIQLNFVTEYNHIRFYYYNTKTYGYGNDIILSKELTEEDKRDFYKSVFRHFFGKVNRINYKAIDRDVPIKLLRPR